MLGSAWEWKRANLEDYELGITVAKGSYCRIKSAKQKKTGNFYAVKVMPKHQLVSRAQVDHVFNELYIHSHLLHFFVVRYGGATQDLKNLYLITELIHGGTLFSYLNTVHAFGQQQSRFFAGSIVLCIEYLHSKAVAYRDLKPENVLIGLDGYIKLADFSFAKVLPQGRTYTVCGTPEYMAPQVILNKGHGRAVDWWALGIFIFELLTGIDPFCDEEPMNTFRNILQNKLFFPKEFNKDAKSLIKHLLTADLSKRYGNLKRGVEEIKGHQWFNTLNWEELNRKSLKPIYIPFIRNTSDLSNLGDYPESLAQYKELHGVDDAFKNW